MGRLLCLGLIVVAAHGCVWPFRREATTPPRTEPRSDRLREVPARSAPVSAETPAPARPPEPAPAPAPAPAPPVAAPAPGTAEPDPSAAIDWLLKQRR